jgi:general secretion pathway protein K
MRSTPRKTPQGGFVLLFVLISIAVLTVMAATIATRVDANRESVQHLRDQGAALTAHFTADQQLRYRLAAAPLGQSLGETQVTLRIDGRPYRIGDELAVMLQDTAGLLDINWAASLSIQRFLIACGVDASEIEALIDVLEDYRDSDELRRPLGAEAPEYAALGLPPPANDRLRSPHELHLLPRWRELLATPRGQQVLAGLTVNRGTGVYPANAERSVLVAMGVPPLMADRIQQIRRQYGAVDRATLEAAVNASGASIFTVSNAPSGILRIRQKARALPWGVEYNLRLTPNGAQAPWQVDYYLRSPPPDLPDFLNLPALPPLPHASQIQSTPFPPVF